MWGDLFPFSVVKYCPVIGLYLGFPGGSDGEESSCNAGDIRDKVWILGSGRSPGEGNGNPLQYSCLENPMDRGAWWATVHGVAKSQTRLSNFTFTFHTYIRICVYIFLDHSIYNIKDNHTISAISSILKEYYVGNCSLYNLRIHPLHLDPHTTMF